MSDDAAKIVAVCEEFIEKDKLVEFFTKLDEEIGKKTNNESVKKTLSMLRAYITPPETKKPFYLWLAFYSLVTGHLLLVIGIIVAFLILPFCADWYIALPLMTFIFFFSTTRIECQLTNLENVLRQKLGMKRIGGFVGHYIMRPFKNLFN
jgi:hypothetical protein